MACKQQVRPRPVHIVLDWDGTLTFKDTTSYIAEFATQRDARTSSTPLSDPATLWPRFGEIYGAEYQEHQLAYRPKPQDRTTCEAESTWLASLREVEDRSAGRVAAMHFLRGVTAADVSEVAKRATGPINPSGTPVSAKLELRKGWEKLLELVLEETDASTDSFRTTFSKLSIVSVNWSETFIRWALWSSHAAHGFRPYINNMEIYANEIHGLTSPEGSSGRFVSAPIIRTSADKTHHLPRGWRQGNHKNEYGDPTPQIVYIGDSPTDFDCLLQADVGICIRDPLGCSSSQRELAETLERLRYRSVHVKEYASWSRVMISEFKGLWWASDFNEIVAFLDLWTDEDRAFPGDRMVMEGLESGEAPRGRTTSRDH